MMTPTAEEQVRGYTAAAKSIKEFAEDAQKRRYAHARADKRNPVYREGYAEGLRFAASFLLLGEKPLENANVIMNILRDEDAAACRKGT